MRKEEIIETLADGRVVEAMVQNIAHRPLAGELKDLSQMVYMILLEYDGEMLQDLWEHGQMGFFIARIIINQYRSSRSPFHVTYRKYNIINEDITGKDFPDEG